VTKHEYEVLAGYAGRHLLRSYPWPIRLGFPFPLPWGRAVYAVYDAEGNCRNVGSVARASGGLACRLREHLTDPVKRSTWAVVYAIPLEDSTPEAEVRRLEGVIGAHLRPRDNRWLPAARPPIQSG